MSWNTARPCLPSAQRGGLVSSVLDSQHCHANAVVFCKTQLLNTMLLSLLLSTEDLRELPRHGDWLTKLLPRHRHLTSTSCSVSACACRDKGIRMAVASRTPTPNVGAAFLRKLGQLHFDSVAACATHLLRKLPLASYVNLAHGHGCAPCRADRLL